MMDHGRRKKKGWGGGGGGGGGGGKKPYLHHTKIYKCRRSCIYITQRYTNVARPLAQEIDSSQKELNSLSQGRDQAEVNRDDMLLGFIFNGDCQPFEAVIQFMKPITVILVEKYVWCMFK